MTLMKIDGEMLREMFLSGSALLDQNRQMVDALNVFPVPDGDTGTNMSQTMTAAVRDLQQQKDLSVNDVANLAASGALKGARGNSGVILSQILRGFSRALDGADKIDAQLFAKAFRLGADTAYKAIMKPKEGTILTVARVIAEEIEKEALKNQDLLHLMDYVVQVGDAILRKTPDMLPVLKQAGVVDSGGKGLMIIYTGFAAALRGEPIEKLEVAAIGETAIPDTFAEFADDHTTLEEIKYAYCTEFIVAHPKSNVNESDVAKLRRRLERIGDSVLVIGDLEVVKVHVHTNEPGRALQMAIELGELDSIKIDNMLEEFRERMAQRQAEAKAQRKAFGIVSVALGDGLVEIFNDLLVDKVVDGGQTMNPSIEDLLEAIEEINAESIFVLPNNTNIILAAQQAAELTEKQVYVIPTKSVPMGIAAAVAFQDGMSPEENVANMTEAAEAVHTGSITYAVRDTNFDGKLIHEGDVMGLIDNKVSLLGTDVERVAMQTLEEMSDDDTEMITIYYGEEISEQQAQALFSKVEEQYPLCDVDMHRGGQPLYYYLLSVE